MIRSGRGAGASRSARRTSRGTGRRTGNRRRRRRGRQLDGAAGDRPDRGAGGGGGYAGQAVVSRGYGSRCLTASTAERRGDHPRRSTALGIGAWPASAPGRASSSSAPAAGWASCWFSRCVRRGAGHRRGAGRRQAGCGGRGRGRPGDRLRPPRRTSEVVDATGGAGPAVALDGVGGPGRRADDNHGRWLTVLRPTGRPSGAFSAIDPEGRWRAEVIVTAGTFTAGCSDDADDADQLLLHFLVAGSGRSSARPSRRRGGARARADGSQGGRRQDPADLGLAPRS